MRKVTAADLEAMQKDGAVVKKRTGGIPRKPEKAPDTKPEKPATPKVEMASMRASQQYYEAQAEALRIVIAKNTAVIEGLRDQISNLKPAPMAERAPVAYEFNIERDKDKLIERVVAYPLED